MKVNQFLMKFQYAASTIKTVTLIPYKSESVVLSAYDLKYPMNPESKNAEILKKTFSSFLIGNQTMFIYCK